MQEEKWTQKLTLCGRGKNSQKVIKQQSILSSGWFRLRSITCNHFAVGVW